MNVFTVDVEEWFHVCGIEATLPPAQWASLPARVVPTTARGLDLLDRAGVSGTFFVVGWIANATGANSVHRCRRGTRSSGSHGQWHDRSSELGADAFGRPVAIGQQHRLDRRATTNRVSRA